MSAGYSMFSDKGILKAGKILQIYKAQSTNTLKMVETLFHKKTMKIIM